MQESLAPIRSICFALIVCFFNIVVPGLGTIISGMCAMPKGNTKVEPKPAEKPKDEGDEGFGGEEEKKEEVEEKKEEVKVEEAKPVPAIINLKKKKEFSRGSAFAAGLCQLLTAPLILGWLWSISLGCTVLENAVTYSRIDKVEKEPEEEPASAKASENKKGDKPKEEEEGQFG
mmetsp:Transcript_36750/g.56295  ORF Transcript_36750/g.56295 Transcript_36750/m.56295 type:complete len:174 (-) Transcript_36750:4-525(-)